MTLLQSSSFRLATLLAAATFSAGAAADWRPDGWMLQGGAAPDDTYATSAGLVWDWDWRLQRRALVTVQTELFLSHWQADARNGGRRGLQQVTLLPVGRLRPDGGRARWFLEAGIGASYLNRDYVTPNKTFSTRWNFYDMLGVGWNFGAAREHEVGLRYVHVSNGSVRSPNPGEDFFLLRYARRF